VRRPEPGDSNSYPWDPLHRTRRCSQCRHKFATVEGPAGSPEVMIPAETAYTAWRQRLRRTLAKRRWAPHGFVGAAEFGPFLALYDTLMARFGVTVRRRLERYHQGPAAAVQCRLPGTSAGRRHGRGAAPGPSGLHAGL
jgi:hypothetical protein